MPLGSLVATLERLPFNVAVLYNLLRRRPGKARCIPHASGRNLRNLLHSTEGVHQQRSYLMTSYAATTDESSVPSLISSLSNTPGPQDYETTPSLSTWDTLFYTRNHPSINTERSRRHLSKLLTYPMSVASVMHRMGPFGTGRGSGNSEAGRVTREGGRSLSG